MIIHAPATLHLRLAPEMPILIAVVSALGVALALALTTIERMHGWALPLR